MTHTKYTEEHRLRQWDLLMVIGALILTGTYFLVRTMMNGQPNKFVVLGMTLGILVLSGFFYYLNNIRLIARYSEKSIKLSMMPIGTVKRKIKWDEVTESEFVETPKSSKWQSWNSQLSSLDRIVTQHSDTCLHLKLKNEEEILIGCNDPKELKEFVQHVKAIK